MANVDTDQNTGTAVSQTDTADIVIGVAAPANEEALRQRSEQLAGEWARAPETRVAIAHPGSNAIDQANGPRNGIRFVPYALPQTAIQEIPWLGSPMAYRSIEEIARKLNAKTCVFIGGDLEALDSQTIEGLANPVLNNKVELAMPLYPIGKYDGLLNIAILYPLTRAVYGRRVRYPLAPEFGISPRLMARLAAQHARGADSGQGQPILWPATEAALAESTIGQVHVDAHHKTQTDGLDLSTVLGQLVGALFTDVEKNAAVWQRVRGSQQVAPWGVPAAPPPDSDGVDVRPMIESFTLGSRNLQEVWGLVLPPVTLLELKRMARLTPEQFRMPDALWAKIVFDFALAYRLRTISRTHLLGALTPLYLGWVASYATEIRDMSAAAAEHRVEQLAKAYEDGKPYLVSRWRWPDRFNP